MRFIYSLVLLALFSCSKENDRAERIEGPPWPWKEVCVDDRVTSKEEIESLLPGRWELVGYQCGLCQPHAIPAAEILFVETTGTVTYETDWSNGEVTEDFVWSIELHHDSTTYILKTSPHSFISSMEVFCLEYMYFNHTPFDGQAMQYKKR